MRRRILLASIPFILIEVPQGIQAWLSLWDAANSPGQPIMNIGELLHWEWLFRVLGVAAFILIICQGRKTQQDGRDRPSNSKQLESENIVLGYLGKVEDQVGAGARDGDCLPDGANDGTFELRIGPMPHILEEVKLQNLPLTREGGVGVWTTAPDTVIWVLGISQDGKRLNERGRKPLGIDLTNGATFRLYASDYVDNPRHLLDKSPCDAQLSLRDIRHRLLVSTIIGPTQADSWAPLSSSLLSKPPEPNQIGLTGDLETRRIPGPSSPNTPQKHFKTQGQRGRVVDIGGKPKMLRFLEPNEYIVEEKDLPKEVPCGDGKLLITRFFDKGFVVDETDTVGDFVRVDFYLGETSS